MRFSVVPRSSARASSAQRVPLRTRAMGDDGGRPRRNVRPVRYEFEPRREVTREHEQWPVRAAAPRGGRGEAARHASWLSLARGCGICAHSACSDDQCCNNRTAQVTPATLERTYVHWHSLYVVQTPTTKYAVGKF